MSENVYFGYGNNIIEAEESSSNCQKSGNGIQHSESKSLKLIFLKPVRGLVFTGIHIGGGESPEIALIDISTGNVVNSGSEASAKVGLFVLKGTFSEDGRDDWSWKEFEESILPGRHGKASLLGKSRHIHLKEGLGSLKDIYFSHTRNPLRKTNVRIGARVVDSSGGIRIREAVSNPFVVKDRRGRNKKDCPISCNDKVWRLVNIGKNGPYHKKLNKENINTVKDLLAMFKDDPEKLRNILEPMPTWKLEATINHAKKCEENSPASVLMNNEEGGLEVNRVSTTGMVSNAHKEEVSDMSVAAFENVGEDGVDGSMIIGTDELMEQLLDTLEPESMTGALLEEEHQQNFDLYYLPPSTMFSAPPADLCRETLRYPVCDVPRGRAHIRWKLLWSILRWLSIRRTVARKLEVLQGHEGLFF